MTRPEVDSLDGILDQLLGLNRELLEVCQAKQEAILDRNFEELELLTEQQESVAERLVELDEQREILARSIAPDRESPVSLDALISTVGESGAEELDEKRVELKNVVRDVQRFSRENVRLLNTRVAVFEDLFERLEEDQSQETYDSDREKDQSGTGEAMLFDEAI